MKMFNSGVTKFYRSLEDIVKKAKDRGIVFCGAGFWGEISYKIFEKYDVYPCCFCDIDRNKLNKIYKAGIFYDEDNAQLKGSLDEIPVITIEEAAKKYPKAIYIATVDSYVGSEKGSLRKEINAELSQRGLLSAESGFHPMRYSFIAEWEGKLSELEGVELEDDRFTSDDIHYLAVFNHMSNTGSVYFDTLIDGNSRILNILLLGHYVPLKEIYINRLQYLQDDELAMEISSQMYVYFKSSISADSFKAGYRLAEEYVVNEEGNPEERIYIDSLRFYNYLRFEIAGKGQLSFGDLLKAIYVAYYNSLGVVCNKSVNYWIFYHSHVANYDLTSLDEFYLENSFVRIEYFTIVRDVIRHFYALIKRFNVDGDETWRCWMGAKENYLPRFEGDLGRNLQKNENTKTKSLHVIKFEDVKSDCARFMKRLCGFMDISYEEIMLMTSVNGLQVYFPVTTGKKEVLTGNDNRTVKPIDYSMLMSEYDIFRLKWIYQKFMQQYGYACDVPALDSFSVDFVKELLKEPFRFEKYIDESTRIWNYRMNIPENPEDYFHNAFVKMVIEYLENYEDREFFELLPE